MRQILLSLFVLSLAVVEPALQQPELVAGRRCLWQRAGPTSSSARILRSPSIVKNDDAPPPPPLVVCVGMAQTVRNWEHHLAPLSQMTTTNRDVLLYEAAGLGPEDEHPPADTPHPDVSLPAQASFLLETIRAAFGQDRDDNITNEDDEQEPIIVVDLAGFSLGGRIALATAVKLGLPQGEQQEQESSDPQIALDGRVSATN